MIFGLKIKCQECMYEGHGVLQTSLLDSEDTLNTINSIQKRIGSVLVKFQILRFLTFFWYFEVYFDFVSQECLGVRWHILTQNIPS